ncbi:MAG: hypothetical protein FJ405_03715 [Verrucomicrobia bacterium]|nr:hypothetical protein [Verrucomicrobiota bacterium]
MVLGIGAAENNQTGGKQILAEAQALVSSASQEDQHVVLEGGRFYKDGQDWKETEERIDPSPGGASAINGPLKLHLAANANSAGLVELTTPSGLRFTSHPAGLFLYSPASGRGIPLAQIRDSIG